MRFRDLALDGRRAPPRRSTERRWRGSMPPWRVARRGTRRDRARRRRGTDRARLEEERLASSGPLRRRAGTRPARRGGRRAVGGGSRSPAEGTPVVDAGDRPLPIAAPGRCPAGDRTGPPHADRRARARPRPRVYATSSAGSWSRTRHCSRTAGGRTGDRRGAARHALVRFAVRRAQRRVGTARRCTRPRRARLAVAGDGRGRGGHGQVGDRRATARSRRRSRLECRRRPLCRR